MSSISMDIRGFLGPTGFLLPNVISLTTTKTPASLLYLIYVGTGFHGDRNHPTCLEVFRIEARPRQPPSKLNEKMLGLLLEFTQKHSKSNFCELKS